MTDPWDLAAAALRVLAAGPRGPGGAVFRNARAPGVRVSASALRVRPQEPSTGVPCTAAPVQVWSAMKPAFLLRAWGLPRVCQRLLKADQFFGDALRIDGEGAGFDRGTDRLHALLLGGDGFYDKVFLLVARNSLLARQSISLARPTSWA